MASAVRATVANGHEESGDGGGGGGGVGGVVSVTGRAHRLPRWTRHEILVLIQGKRVVESRGRRRGHRMAAHAAVAVLEPKWVAVASYCRRRGVDRGAVQCRKRWSNLACDFRKIRAWEKGPGEAEGESFWAMRNDRRRERRLPGFFDREVYEILDRAAGVEAEGAAEEEEEGKKALAVEEEEDDDEEEEAIFDSGRTAADDGLFSDFEQEEEAAAADEAEERPRAMVVVPISERKYEPLPQERSDPGMLNNKQPTDNTEKGSSLRGKKRKQTSQEEGGGDINLQNQLIEILERNSKLLTAQVEAQNVNCQLDRDLRKDQANSLFAVLNKLADALGKIADKL